MVLLLIFNSGIINRHLLPIVHRPGQFGNTESHHHLPQPFPLVVILRRSQAPHTMHALAVSPFSQHSAFIAHPTLNGRTCGSFHHAAHVISRFALHTVLTSLSQLRSLRFPHHCELPFKCVAILGLRAPAFYASATPNVITDRAGTL